MVGILELGQENSIKTSFVQDHECGGEGDRQEQRAAQVRGHRGQEDLRQDETTEAWG